MLRPRDEPAGAADPNERPRARRRLDPALEKRVLDELLSLDNMNVAQQHVLEPLDAHSLARLQLVLLMRHEMPGALTPETLRARLALVWEQLLYRDHAPAFPSNDQAPRRDSQGRPLPASHVYPAHLSVNHAFAQMFEVLRSSGRPASLLLAQRVYAAARLVMRIMVMAIQHNRFATQVDDQQVATIFAQHAADCILGAPLLAELDAQQDRTKEVFMKTRPSNTLVAPRAWLEVEAARRESMVLVQEIVAIDARIPDERGTPLNDLAHWAITDSEEWDGDEDEAERIARGRTYSDRRGREEPRELAAWTVTPTILIRDTTMRAEQAPLGDPDLNHVMASMRTLRIQVPATATSMGQWRTPVAFVRRDAASPRFMAVCTVCDMTLKPTVKETDAINDFFDVMYRPFKIRQRFQDLALVVEPVVFYHTVIQDVDEILENVHWDLSMARWPTLARDHWAGVLLRRLNESTGRASVARIVNFALGLDRDVLGFAHFLEHDPDALDLLYGLGEESTHSRPKLRFFDQRCVTCGLQGMATHVVSRASAPAFLCPTCVYE